MASSSSNGGGGGGGGGDGAVAAAALNLMELYGATGRESDADALLASFAPPATEDGNGPGNKASVRDLVLVRHRRFWPASADPAPRGVDSEHGGGGFRAYLDLITGSSGGDGLSAAVWRLAGGRSGALPKGPVAGRLAVGARLRSWAHAAAAAVEAPADGGGVGGVGGDGDRGGSGGGGVGGGGGGGVAVAWAVGEALGCIALEGALAAAPLLRPAASASLSSSSSSYSSSPAPVTPVGSDAAAAAMRAAFDDALRSSEPQLFDGSVAVCAAVSVAPPLPWTPSLSLERRVCALGAARLDLRLARCALEASALRSLGPPAHATGTAGSSGGGGGSDEAFRQAAEARASAALAALAEEAVEYYRRTEAAVLHGGGGGGQNFPIAAAVHSAMAADAARDLAGQGGGEAGQGGGEAAAAALGLEAWADEVLLRSLSVSGGLCGRLERCGLRCARALAAGLLCLSDLRGGLHGSCGDGGASGGVNDRGAGSGGGGGGGGGGAPAWGIGWPALSSALRLASEQPWGRHPLLLAWVCRWAQVNKALTAPCASRAGGG